MLLSAVPEDWDDNTSFYRRSQRPVLFASQLPEARDARQQARLAGLSAPSARDDHRDAIDPEPRARVLDYHQRVAGWRAHARRLRNAEEPWRLYWAMTSGHHAGGLGFVIVWLPLIVLWTALKWVFGVTINQRLTRRLSRGECPRCGYSICGRLNVDVDDKLAASCTACPECGYSWPLWPPGG